MKKKLRRLVIDGTPYLWGIAHLHLPCEEAPGHRCAERLTVYREGARKAPARLTFVASPGVLVGYPSSGVVELPNEVVYNLNTPSIVALLIRGFEGWNPEHQHSAWEADDGVDRLRVLPATGYARTPPSS